MVFSEGRTPSLARSLTSGFAIISDRDYRKLGAGFAGVGELRRRGFGDEGEVGPPLDDVHEDLVGLVMPDQVFRPDLGHAEQRCIDRARERDGGGRAVGAGDGDDLGAELAGLDADAPGDVAEAGDGDGLALEAVALRLEHLLGEVGGAEAGGLGAHERAAEREALAGELVGEAFVLAEHVANLAAAHADVARGHVGVGTDVAEELGHEALAEAHDLVVALAVRVEVRAALVRADGGVELDAVAAVDVVLALVVHPGHLEHDRALGLDDAVEDALGLVLGLGLDEGLDGLEDLFGGLEKFGFPRIAGLEAVQDFNYLIANLILHYWLQIDVDDFPDLFHAFPRS